MDETQKKEGMLFFPGWPAMIGLLEPFFSILRKNFRLIIFGQESTFQFRPEEKVIGVSYSAGVEKLLNAVREHPEKFSKLVFVAPAGSAIMPNPLLLHYWRFFGEVLKLLKKGKWKLSWGITKEVFLNFLNSPLKSFKEVEKIRKFDFWAEINSVEKLPPCFFIFPANDNLICSYRGKVGEIGTYFVDSFSSGHFGLVENSWHYNKNIKQIIRLSEQIDELQKGKDREDELF